MFGEEDYDWAWEQSEQDWANRWVEAWDRLEAHGIVSHPEDSNLPLSELERLTALLGDKDD
jgi:hypothetical protein